MIFVYDDFSICCMQNTLLSKKALTMKTLLPKVRKFRKLHLESLEERQMLSINVPNDPDHIYDCHLAQNRMVPEVQTIWLNFEGAEDVTFRGPETVEALEIPAFNAPEGNTTETMEQICSDLNTLFESQNVHFVLSPPDTGEYSTVYLGGTNEAFLSYGDFLGLAESVDTGNLVKDDIALVFSETISAQTAPAELRGKLTQIIAHESGHLIGLSHSDDALGGMMAGGFSNDGDSLWGEVATTGDGKNKNITDATARVDGKPYDWGDWHREFSDEYLEGLEKWADKGLYYLADTWLTGSGIYRRVFKPYLDGNSTHQPNTLYLTNGDPMIEAKKDDWFNFFNGFKNVPETQNAVKLIKSLVENKAKEYIHSGKALPALTSLHEFLNPVEVKQVAMETLSFGPGDTFDNIPGYLVGGVGGYFRFENGKYKYYEDDRDISGFIYFSYSYSEDAYLATIFLTITVKDAFDFAPGDPGGIFLRDFGSAELNFGGTGRLHALEINDHAAAVPIEAVYSPDPVSIRIPLSTPVPKPIEECVPPTPHVVMMFDTSYSMADDVAGMKQQAKSMVQGWKNSYPNIQVAVGTYGNHACSIGGFSSNVDAICAAIDAWNYVYNTSGEILYEALGNAINKLPSPSDSIKNIVLVFTDEGDDPDPWYTEKYTSADVQRMAAEKKVSFSFACSGTFTAGGSGQTAEQQKQLVKDLANSTGGQLITGTALAEGANDVLYTGTGVIRASGTASTGTSGGSSSASSTVTFDASTSYSTKGAIARIEWDFEDNGKWVDASSLSSAAPLPGGILPVGAPPSGSIVTHTYEYGYNGDAVLRITDSTGLKSTARIPVSAACVVTTASDVVNANDNVISLREAIANAKPGTAIVFADALKGQTISISSTLIINKNLTIYGSGQKINYTGTGANIFEISTANTEVSISGLTMTGGGIYARGSNVTLNVIECSIADVNATGNGGGFAMNGGTLNFINSSLANNTTTGNGGGVYMNGGTLNLIGSTIAGNTTTGSTGFGGGVYMYGGTLNMIGSTIAGNSAAKSGGIGGVNYAMYIDNSLIVGNKATGEGGGIYYVGTSSSTSTILNTTIAGNTASRGGGIYNETRNINLVNSMISNNVATDSPDIWISNNTSTSIGANYSLIGNTTTNGKAATNVGNTSKFNVDPKFVKFTTYATAAWTKNLWKNWDLRLQLTSPARDTGSNNYVASIYDIDGKDRISNGRVDMGAYEIIKLATPVLKTVTATSSNVTNNSTISVTWDKVANANGYTIQYATNSAFTAGVGTITASASATSKSIPNLKVNTTYYVRIMATATGNIINSDYSAHKSATTPKIKLAKPTGITLTATSSVITVAWNAVANARGYTIEYATNAEFTGAGTVTASASATTKNLSGLTTGTTYYVRIIATGTGNYTNSDYSASKTVTTKLATPKLKTPTATNSVITVTWDTVADATGYTIQYATNAEFTTGMGKVKAGASETSVNITGRKANTTYYVRVMATGTVVNSDYSASKTVTTPTKLAKPTLGTVSVLGSSSISVAWTAVANATGYTIQYATDSAFTTGVGTVTAVASATSKSITNLTTVTTYYVRVMAKGTGAYANSEYSSAKSATTPSVPAAPMPAAATRWDDDLFAFLAEEQLSMQKKDRWLDHEEDWLTEFEKMALLELRK